MILVTGLSAGPPSAATVASTAKTALTVSTVSHPTVRIHDRNATHAGAVDTEHRRG